MPVSVYCISAVEDDEHLRALQTHTALLRRTKVLELADRSTVAPGTLASDDEPVARAQLVLVLLTAAFFDDDGCWDLLTGALRRGQRVVPLRVQKCEVEGSGIERLAALPRGGAWITESKDAWAEVCAELKKMAAEVPTEAGAAVAVLPPPPRCLGRDDDRRTLVAQLLAPEPSIVLGGAGLGKTTLLVSALHDPAVAALYGGRRYFVRCDSATTRDGIVLSAAQVLGVPLNPQLEPSVLARLREAPTLLALDNAETPWEADREAVEDLLLLLSGAAKLVLTLRGAERPGRVPFQPPLTPRPLTQEDARRVFLAVAGDRHAADPRLDLLVSAVDRLPLALTLLAHRAEPDPDLSAVWSEWQEQGPAAASRGQGRLDDLTRSLELSIHGPRMRACPAAARLLSLLGLLPDGIAWDDLSTLLPTESRDAARALRRVGLAFDEDLMLRVPAPVREHARRRCPPSEEDEARALPLYLTRAAELGDQVGYDARGAAASARLAAESRNIEAAIDNALAQKRHHEAANALWGFGNFARFSGYRGRVAELLKQAAVQSPVRIDRAWCFLRLGTIALGRSNHREASDCFDAAMLLFQQANHIQGQAICIKCLGDLVLNRLNHAEKRLHFNEVLVFFQQIGDIQGQANCIRTLGEIALDRSEYAEARARFDAAFTLYKQVDDLQGQANCIMGYGEIALNCSEYEEARVRLDAAFRLFQQIGDLQGKANCIKSLGDLRFKCLDYAEAQTYFGAALSLYQRVSDFLGQANCIKSLGDIALKRTDFAEARACFEAALPLYQRSRTPLAIGWTQIRLARLCEDPQERRALAAAAFAAWRSIDREDLVQRHAPEFPDAV